VHAQEEAKQAAKAAAKAEKRRAKTPSSSTVSNGRPGSKKKQRTVNQFGDYGDIEVAGAGSNSTANPLQSLMNSIQQRERVVAKSAARRGDTSGDAEVDGQTRGGIQRAAQRRPAPGTFRTYNFVCTWLCIYVYVCMQHKQACSVSVSVRVSVGRMTAT
jgi:hypothetical protein